MFNNDLTAGNAAENVFWNMYGQISNCNILTPIRTYQERIEGKDVTTVGITKKGLRNIAAEVKAVLKNNYITRDNDNDEPSGTLPFELWANAWDENGKIKTRRIWTAGWLPAMLHPQAYNERNITEGKSVSVQAPDQLAFMLCDDAEGKKPYACILFDSFTKLKKRLYQIAPFDLEHLVSPIHRYDYWANKQLNVPFNTWYVALDKLIDLAKITLFEDTSIQIDQQKKCPINIQNSRKDYLLNHVDNRINIEEECKNAQRAGKAYNRDRRLPEDAEIPHMTYFDPLKLPSWVKVIDTVPDWIKEAF